MEHDDKTNAGELIIDNDCVEFSVVNTAEPFPSCFVGGNWDFKCKVYTHGMGETKKTNLGCGYRVQKVVRYNGDFNKYPGEHIEGIREFSFEILELVDWLNKKSIHIDFAETGEFFAVQENIPAITLKNGNPSIQIKYELSSSTLFNVEKTEVNIKCNPRIYITYEDYVNDIRVYDDIESIMRFFGLLCGYISYAKDIRAKLKDDVIMLFYFNFDFSHNMNMKRFKDRMRSTYDMLKDNLSEYFEKWYDFNKDDIYFLPRTMFFNSNKKKQIDAQDLFVQYCKILEGYNLRINKDEEKADYLEIDLTDILKTTVANNLFSAAFKKAGSKYKPKDVASWIKRGFIERISLDSRLQKLDKQYGNIISKNTKFVYESDVSNDYFKAIVKTRNFYSHYKEERYRDEILTFRQLHNTIDVLKILIYLIFLSHMGMDLELSKKVMAGDGSLFMYSSCLLKDSEH